MNNDLQCLVCTCACGMSIDQKDVRLVVHYVMPVCFNIPGELFIREKCGTAA